VATAARLFNNARQASRRTSTHYTYEQLYRLTQASTRTNQYTYDPAGNA